MTKKLVNIIFSKLPAEKIRSKHQSIRVFLPLSQKCSDTMTSFTLDFKWHFLFHKQKSTFLEGQKILSRYIDAWWMIYSRQSYPFLLNNFLKTLWKFLICLLLSLIILFYFIFWIWTLEFFLTYISSFRIIFIILYFYFYKSINNSRNSKNLYCIKSY